MANNIEDITVPFVFDENVSVDEAKKIKEAYKTRPPPVDGDTFEIRVSAYEIAKFRYTLESCTWSCLESCLDEVACATEGKDQNTEDAYNFDESDDDLVDEEYDDEPDDEYDNEHDNEHDNSKENESGENESGDAGSTKKQKKRKRTKTAADEEVSNEDNSGNTADIKPKKIVHKRNSLKQLQCLQKLVKDNPKALKIVSDLIAQAAFKEARGRNIYTAFVKKITPLINKYRPEAMLGKKVLAFAAKIYSKHRETLSAQTLDNVDDVVIEDEIIETIKTEAI